MNARPRRFPRFFLAALVLVGVTALVVGPGGDFPLHDDWVHRHEVDVLYREHRYEGAPIITSTLVAQALWGTLFAEVFGLDYLTLRLATLVLAVLGTWAAARCATEAGLTAGMAVTIAALFWFTPLVTPLAFTFMTDVPFACVLVLGAFCALRSLRTLEEQDAAAAIALFWVAFFIRQHGVVLLGAYLATLVVAGLGGTRFPRAFLLAAAAMTLAGAGAAAGWLALRPGNPEQAAWLGHVAAWLTTSKVKVAIRYLVVVLANMGLFATPLLGLRLAQLMRGEERWGAGRWLLVALVFALGVTALYRSGGPLPLGHDVLHDLGLGWRTLTSDENRYLSPAPLGLGAAGWWVLTAIGLAGGAIGVVDALGAVARVRIARFATAAARQQAFLFLWCGLFVASLLPFLPRTADRYMIPALLPAWLLAAGAIAPLAGARRWAPALVPLAVLAAFSTAATQDYLAWNRARWQALGELFAAGASPNEIDGGFEFNGVFTRETYRRQHGRPDDRRIGERGFWVVADRYAISFAPRRGFEEIGRYPYFTLLGMTERELLVLERTGPVPPNPPREEPEDYDARPL